MQAILFNGWNLFWQGMASDRANPARHERVNYFSPYVKRIRCGGFRLALARVLLCYNVWFSDTPLYPTTMTPLDRDKNSTKKHRIK
jgi:hypothetical protein